LCRVDLEGHAVLIVGYDDERAAFLLADPWNKDWGGIHSRKRWLGYNEMSMVIVDGTKDVAILPTPLEVDVEEVDCREETAIDIGVSFYNPNAIVMDRANQIISNVDVEISDGLKSMSVSVTGEWHVGEEASLRITGLEALLSGKVILTVKAEIGGDRPYRYRDTVSVSQPLRLRTAMSRSSLVA